MNARRKNHGFTLLELLVSVALIALLFAILTSAFHRVKRQAQKVGCMANMKNIHTGFDAHILDKGYWPQMTGKSLEGEESDYNEFWIRSLEPYGVVAEIWVCPSDKNLTEDLKKGPYSDDKYKSSYFATRFNPHVLTPYRWNQPWLAERGDYHGQGALKLMPDGSVNSAHSAFGGR